MKERTNAGTPARSAQPALHVSRRALVAGSAAVLASGCFGKFGATMALYDWNKDVSDSKWLRWLVFLVLVILPVYGLFVLADVLVLNTIEFFTGNNPVSGGHVELEDGHTLTSKRTDDPNLIRHEHRKDGKLVRVLFVRRVSDEEFVLLDERHRVLTRVKLDEKRRATLLDGRGRVLSVMSEEACDRAAMAMRRGEPFTRAVHAEAEIAPAVMTG
jgi:hypothetical protein